MENCWEEAPHSSQDCYPHYNLFQSSIFYDTDNFRVSYLLEDCIPSESSENEERSAEPPDKPPEAPPKAKRVISKLELYRDPDLFRSDDGQPNTNGPIEPPSEPLPQPWGYDWTKQSWVKEGAPVLVIPKNPDEPDKRVCKPVGPPVNNRKAESMMHKMGWQGGALGKAGHGIVEPLGAHPICAFRSTAAGGAAAAGGTAVAVAVAAGARPAGERRRAADRRDAFRTNVLLRLLEFVQDDTETELLFDAGLSKQERRLVTGVVSTVGSDAALHGLGSAAQYDLARDIHAHNKYLLTCEQGDHNQLGIYKEAPEEVYLVTPEDFLAKDTDDVDKDDHVNNAKDDNHVNGVKEDNHVNSFTEDKTNGELDDDENPFLKSIKKSIKNDDEPKSITNKFETDCVIAKENEHEDVGHKAETPVPPADKILEFFLEFAETEVYKEMRFLGTFSESQSSAINALLNDVSLWSAGGGPGCPAGPGGPGGPGCPGGSSLAARGLRAGGGGFRVAAGAHDTPEIHKTPARNQKTSSKV